MSLLANSNAIESGGYNIDRSLRFRSSASAYLNRTFGTPTNNQKYTVSTWVKRGALSNGQVFSVTNGSYYAQIIFYNDTLYCQDYTASASYTTLQTNAVYRDPSAWYHVVFSIDTTQATASNRANLYVNGVQVTSFQSSSYPTQNSATTGNSTGATGYLGQLFSSQYFDGYLAEVNFIDGQALTPSSFGETSTETGVWVPKKYTGTYGTNGFYLNFSDNTSATTLAYDKSGNGNNWTPNNISTTAGATYDSMTDVPTLTSATAANFAVASPIDKNTNITVSNANLTVADASNTNSSIRSTIGVSSGKWYWEWTVASVTTFVGGGIATPNTSLASYIGDTADSYGYLSHTGDKYNNGTASAYGATFTTNDVIGVALDLDSGTLTYYKNNVSQGTAFTGLSGTFIPAFSCRSGSLNINFGQRPFSYTPPTGFKALNTFNLPDPTIKKPNQYMDASLYTGNAGSITVTNSGFQPDLVWVKARSSAYDHKLVDSVRGSSGGIYYDLQSNTTGAESLPGAGVNGLTSTGFTIGGGTNNGYNGNGTTFVGWQWKKGATPGFDIVTYTGNGANRTIAHNLGIAPSMMIVKRRDSSASGWIVYHKYDRSDSYNTFMVLNSTDAVNYEPTAWNSTAPTSSVFSLGSYAGTNANTGTFVNYLFAEISGFSKFGSYTGNGSTDGTYVHCGFRPACVILKRSNGSYSWYTFDNKRDGYNVNNNSLSPNLSDAEYSGGTYTFIDLLSNGFKLRNTYDAINASGGTYIYAAFAENPFKYSNAR